MLPNLYHGAGVINQSRLEYQQSDNRNQIGVNTDASESRLNKSRLLEYGGGMNYSNEHMHMSNQPTKGANRYASDYAHLPNIRHND